MKSISRALRHLSVMFSRSLTRALSSACVANVADSFLTKGERPTAIFGGHNTMCEWRSSLAIMHLLVTENALFKEKASNYCFAYKPLLLTFHALKTLKRPDLFEFLSVVHPMRTKKKKKIEKSYVRAEEASKFHGFAQSLNEKHCKQSHPPSICAPMRSFLL